MKIIKLGGSIISKRDIWREADFENIYNIANQLKQIREPMIIIHGLGSFGRAYLPIYNGRYIDKSQVALARYIQAGLRNMNDIVVSTFIIKGLKIRTFEPESIFQVYNDKIIDFNDRLFANYLEKGVIPIIYGGTVWDDSEKYTIVSSDEIVAFLAKYYNADLVIWATDVDGVYGKKGLIESFSKNSLNEFDNWEYNQKDLTGGMLNKVLISLELSKIGIPSYVVNGQTKDRLSNVLNDETTICTKFPCYN